ncbi:MAG: hypothetical protein RIR97_1296 [Pseudomonadota bacterium]
MDTLTRIRAFIDVVDAEGFSAAGRKVGRSKALLSKYVRELEDELGALLLNRTTRQFSLTEAGQTYYRTASEILSEIESLADLVRETTTGLKGRLRISAPRSVVDADIGQSFIDFSLAHPDLVLDIVADDKFVDLVEDGFDVAIRSTKLEDSGLIAKKLYDFGAIACASRSFVEKYGPFVHPSDLSRVPCIIDTNRKAKSAWPFQDPDGTHFTVQVKGPIEVNSPTATLRAARSGLGVAMVPLFTVSEKIKCGEMVQLFGDYSPGNRGIYAIYPHKRYLPAKVRVFVDFMHGWFKTHTAQE